MTISIYTGQHLGSYGSMAALLQLLEFSFLWSTTIIRVTFSISIVIIYMHTNHGPGSHLYVPTYCILSSKCLSPCKRPPWPCGVLYIQMACLCKRPSQFFGPSISSAHGCLIERIRYYKHFFTPYTLQTSNFYHWESDITSLVNAMIPLQHHNSLQLHVMYIEYIHYQAHSMFRKYPSIGVGSPHNVCTLH